jgi:transcription antitermination factor NusG
VKTIELPLFPQYVFGRFSLESHLKVTGLPSVTSIVGFGGIPARIRQEEIDVLKRVATQDLIMPWPFLRVGERVRVRTGPLSGVEGFLAREKAGYRVVVNIEILQRAVAVELERDLLEPVKIPAAIQVADKLQIEKPSEQFRK